jgi:hypothetical protein
LKRLWLASFALMLAVSAVATYFLFRERWAPPPPSSEDPVDIYTAQMLNAHKQEEKILQVITPAKAWRLDDQLRKSLRAGIALKRNDERVTWLAAAGKDFGARQPREAELTKGAIERLEGLFGESLEVADPTQKFQVSGRAAQALEFKGTSKQVVWHGLCFCLARHGIGYWFFLAAPTPAEAQEEWRELQKDRHGFILADERRGWREQPLRTDTFQSEKLPFALTAPEGLWEKKNAGDLDEHGLLLLYGRYTKEKDNRKSSQVLLVALNRGRDPLQAARDYFLAERRKENKDYLFEKMADGSLTDQLSYVEIKVQLGSQPARYLLIAASQSESNNIGILCESTWEGRPIWRQDFLDLLRSIKKSEPQT